MSESPMSLRKFVLVVEDEPLLLLNAVDIVEEAGFDCIKSANADAAIRILTAREDIRIVFTDINMPGSLDGLKLAHFIRDRWPPISLIVTSGQVAPTVTELPIGAVFLSKPFEPEQLVAALVNADI